MLVAVKQGGCTALRLTCDGERCVGVFETDCAPNQRREVRYRANAAGWLTTRSPETRRLVDYCPEHRKD